MAHPKTWLRPRYVDGVPGEPKPIRGNFVPYRDGMVEVGRTATS